MSFLIVIVGIGYFNHHFIGLIKSFRIPYLFIGISLAIWICICLEVLSNTKLNGILSNLGGLSLELYLSHIILRKFFILTPIYEGSAVANYNKYIIFVIIGSFVISKLISKLYKNKIIKIY